jgi:lysophospholipase L1-like esterase
MLTACGNGFQAQKGSSQSMNVLNSTFTVGVLGDSISRGLDISTLGQEDVADNWATGSSLPSSLVNQFQNAFSSLSVFVNGLNLAVSGDSVLGGGSKFANEASVMAASHPQVVVIEIGANDVCQGNLSSATAVSQFQTDVASALTTLTQASPAPQAVVVASIPHIFALTQISTLSNNQTCQLAWQVVCPNLQVGQTAFEAQWNSANQALQQAVTSVGGVVAYDGGAIANTAFTANDVSTVDCFHPSVSGQTKIADAIWAGFKTSH